MKMLLPLFICSILLVKYINSAEIYTCENNTLNVTCATGFELIINSANYGRHNSTICPLKDLDRNINCSSSNATRIVQQRCQGAKNCSFLVSNQLFSDPCVGTYKYLQLNYNCEPKTNMPQTPIITPTQKFVCEGETLNIQCAPIFRPIIFHGFPLPFPRRIIHIVYGNYGRHDSKICPKTGLDQNINCSSSNATAILKQRCEGRNFCSVPVTNKTFSDPCQGTYKYLELNYTCVLPLYPPTRFCGPNEEFGCYNPCYQNCGPQRSQIVCIRPEFCWIRRCVCRLGYKRDSRTGRCVAQQFCPIPGPENETHEVFSQCGAACQRTCNNTNPVCTLQCVPGYVCAENYVREDFITRRCIPPAECRARSK